MTNRRRNHRHIKKIIAEIKEENDRNGLMAEDEDNSRIRHVVWVD